MTEKAELMCGLQITVVNLKQRLDEPILVYPHILTGNLGQVDRIHQLYERKMLTLDSQSAVDESESNNESDTKAKN